MTDLSSYLRNYNPSYNQKKDKIKIQVSLGSCAIARGAKLYYDYLSDNLDKDIYELDFTGCMGLCYAEPTIRIINKSDKYIIGNLETNYIEEFTNNLNNNSFDSIKKFKIEKNILIKEIVLKNSSNLNPSSLDNYLDNNGFQGIFKTLTSKIDPISIILESNLRGRGGAGFPTGKKLLAVKSMKESTKHVVCNGDEGDPGAFMDRALLEGDPFKIIEGMLIAGKAINAKNGYIYVRAEYPLAIKRVQEAINICYKHGLLGINILNSNFSFDLDIKYGAGAFVCGEETALIHSMEGDRGEPTLRPPYPFKEGYEHYPTLVNNVETFANIPNIIINGSEWFNKIGTGESKGTKIFSLTGDIKKPGLIEVEMGTKLSDIIFNIGGGIKNDFKLKAIQTGGPCGGALTQKELGIKITYEDLRDAGSIMGSGGMIIISEKKCMVNMAKFFMEFSASESCGKCTPCRIGTTRIYELLDKITKGESNIPDLNSLIFLCQTLQVASLCGLGKSAPNPVLSFINKFKDEFLDHINNKKCPTLVCKDLINYSILNRCIGCGACKINCPVGAITGSLKKLHHIDQTICIKCGKCFEVCKFKSIKRE